MASDTDPKVIVLNGSPRITDELAAGAVTPGHLVSRDTAGKFVVHATASGNAAKLFADLIPFQSNLPAGTKAIDKAYASGDSIRLIHARSGDVLYALVAANAPAIVIGDDLESGAAGALRKAVPQAVAEGGAANYNVIPNPLVAQALEAVDNSAGGTQVRIRVEVL